MTETHFIPAQPGLNILAVYRAEDGKSFGVCTFPCLFIMVDNERTVPMGLFDLPRRTVYVGLQHQDGSVSVAAENTIYTSKDAFLIAASQALTAIGMKEPRSWEIKPRTTKPRKRKDFVMPNKLRMAENDLI